MVTVLESVAPHLVPPGGNLHHGVGVGAHLVSEHEEGRPHVQLVQHIERLTRIGGRAVVEGEAHLGTPGRRPPAAPAARERLGGVLPEGREDQHRRNEVGQGRTGDRSRRQGHRVPGGRFRSGHTGYDDVAAPAWSATSSTQRSQ